MKVRARAQDQGQDRVQGSGLRARGSGLGARGSGLGAQGSGLGVSHPTARPIIGQVHRATLRGGMECVVKVQYPNAKRFFATDMRTLTRFCR